MFVVFVCVFPLLMSCSLFDGQPVVEEEEEEEEVVVVVVVVGVVVVVVPHLLHPLHLQV